MCPFSHYNLSKRESESLLLRAASGRMQMKILHAQPAVLRPPKLSVCIIGNEEEDSSPCCLAFNSRRRIAT